MINYSVFQEFWHKYLFLSLKSNSYLFLSLKMKNK